MPFTLFVGLTLWMFYTIAYVPGGQPIGALERSFAKLGGWIGKLWKKRPGAQDLA